MTDKNRQEPRDSADEKRAGTDDRPTVEASRTHGRRKAFRVTADLDVVYIGTVTLDQIVAARYELEAHGADISDDAHQRSTEALRKLQLEYTPGSRRR